jgi:hypothetical protein
MLELEISLFINDYQNKYGCDYCFHHGFADTAYQMQFLKTYNYDEYRYRASCHRIEFILQNWDKL